jgi:DNA-binding CsgD family transcriptional regulator/GAF domain-containing protein
MEELHYQQLRHALKIIKTASSAADVNVLTSKVLDVICESLGIDRGLFILPDGAAKFTDFRARNVEEKYQKQFKEYYHQYDPFNLIPGDACRKRVVRVEDLVSYPSFLTSEYYNDFLRPQQIYYKTVVYLKSRDRLLGMIALLRPQGARSFSKEDVALLRAVSPYVTHALEDLELRNSIRVRENIFRAVETHLSGALMVLDDSWNLLYANHIAEEQNHLPTLPRVLLEDCFALKEDSKAASAACPVLPKYRVLKGLQSKAFSVHSRVLPTAVTPDGRMLFVVSIEELAEERPKLRSGGEEKLKSAYPLSEREVEIVYKVCEGLRNSEIAERLFIAEITVKKHIQNIFDKTGVQSRSALIHKILTSEFS